MSSDESSDLITDRGFRHTDWVQGVKGYGGRVKVYESSGAAAPRVWLSIEQDLAMARLRDGSATIHLEVADALALAENIIRTCRLHYQLQGDVSDG